MLPVDAVHWIVQGLEVCYLSFHIHEGMLMLHSVNRACKIFDVVQVLLDLLELMTPIDIQNRVVKILEVCYLPFNIHECMLMFNSVNGTCKILQTLHFLFDFIEVVSVVNILPDREVHLLESVKALQDFTVLVFSINLVNRIVEGFQVGQIFLNFCKVVSSLYCVNRTLENLQI